MTVGSLFSGIGGLELGMEMAAPFTTLWQAERDPYASAVLAKHWPSATRFTDVRDVTAATVPGVDILCGGFPCQPHSLAGKRLSSADERDLWGEFARIAGEIGPRWVVAENVPGLLSSHDPAHGRGAGGFFGRVLRDLAQLGFDAEWHSIPAAAVGAPHLRYRVFLVAYTQRLRRSAATQRTGDAKPDRTRENDQPGHAGRDAAPVAYAAQLGCATRNQPAQREHGETSSQREGQPGGVCPRAADVAHPRSAGRTEQLAAAIPGSVSRATWRGDAADWAGGDWGQPSPLAPGFGGGFRGVADGFPARLDRLRALGNAVVPQVGAVIGRAIWEAEECRRLTGRLPQQIVTRRHLEVPA